VNDYEEIAPTFLIARTVLLNLQQPNIFIGATSLGSAILPSVNMIKTLFSSKESNNADEVAIMGRCVARKLCFDDSHASTSDMVLSETFVP
jgi:hypothetical protein